MTAMRDSHFRSIDYVIVVKLRRGARAEGWPGGPRLFGEDFPLVL